MPSFTKWFCERGGKVGREEGRDEEREGREGGGREERGEAERYGA
jgi:hypothetical protein